jgi:hypothetical protein
MKRSLFLLLAIAAAAVIATASSAHGQAPPLKPHKGALHVTKTVRGLPRRRRAVLHDCVLEHRRDQPGMQVVYLQALSHDGTLTATSSSPPDTGASRSATSC